jgi:hypothetical protein
MLELKFVTKKARCNPTLFIVIPQESRNGSCNHDSYRPEVEEIEKYLKRLKIGGQCQGCKASCAIYWIPQGFKNHMIAGENHSSSQDPKISWMFCANTEIPILVRQLMSGGRELNI